MIFVIDQQSRSATTNEISAIDEFNDSLRDNGHWVTAAGLTSPENAAVIDNRTGIPELHPGSAFKSDDFYSGFWIIEAGDADVAETLAIRASKACNRRVELRPFL